MRRARGRGEEKGHCRDFDEAIVCPIFGYKDYVEYYEDVGVGMEGGEERNRLQSALHYKVNRICVPMLAIQSADDCFAPVNSQWGEENGKEDRSRGLDPATRD